MTNTEVVDQILIEFAVGKKNNAETRDAILQIIERERKSEWIAATPETMPEDAEQVIVGNADHQLVESSFYMEKLGWLETTINPTHWQPLPSPPVKSKTNPQ